MYDTISNLFYRKTDSPCKGCTKRTAVCHGICKDYAEWVKKEQTRCETIRTEKTNESAQMEIEVKCAIKQRRRKK